MLLTDFWKKLKIYLNQSLPDLTILSIDRSEPRFESHTGGKIRKTFKNNQNFDVFCKFLAISDTKLFAPDQENERHDI